MVKIHSKKKAAWFPGRPFLSYGGSTLTGDFRTSAPGAYLPAVSYSVAAANRGSRELWPETDAMVSHLRKMTNQAMVACGAQGRRVRCPRCSQVLPASSFRGAPTGPRKARPDYRPPREPGIHMWTAPVPQELFS